MRELAFGVVAKLVGGVMGLVGNVIRATGRALANPGPQPGRSRARIEYVGDDARLLAERNEVIARGEELCEAARAMVGCLKDAPAAVEVERAVEAWDLLMVENYRH